MSDVERSGRGRPTKYKPEYAELALKFCLLGADDKKLAEMFEVDESTINEWKKVHPSFSQSVKQGKDEADAVVASSLYQRAKGYSHKAVKIFADPKSGAEKIVEYTEHYPPDPTSMIFWLKNRQKNQWRDKLDVANTHSFEQESTEDLQKRAALLSAKLGVLPKNEDLPAGE